MDIGYILFKQIIIMFFLMGIGYYLYKTNKITKQGSKELGTLMIQIVIPVIILKSFWIESTPEKIQILIITFVISLCALIIAIIISKMFYKNNGIENFSCAFSNAGFIGIPLVSATLGENAVFYIACFIAELNILQWTYGVYIMTKDKQNLNMKKIIYHPIILSFLLGLIIFLSNLPQPEMIKTTLTLIAGINTPIAMIISGVYLAQSNLKEMLTSLSLYKASFIRLVLIPFITFLFLLCIPHVNVSVKLAILTAASAPTGANVAIYAQLYNKDYILSVFIVCLTTLLSMITLPVIISLAYQFF